MVVIAPPLVDGWMPIQQEETPDVTGSSLRSRYRIHRGINGAVATIVVPGIADENECHKLALKINAPKHACFECRMAVPHADVADAVQDELQDQGVIR